jgi:transcription initiation factor TFIID subunit 2
MALISVSIIIYFESSAAFSGSFQCAIRKLDYLGLFHLFKLFLRYCYDPEDAHQDLFTHTYVPRPNDFSDLSEYFVRKVAVITSVQCRH